MKGFERLQRSWHPAVCTSILYNVLTRFLWHQIFFILGHVINRKIVHRTLIYSRECTCHQTLLTERFHIFDAFIYYLGIVVNPREVAKLRDGVLYGDCIGQQLPMYQSNFRVIVKLDGRPLSE